MLYEISLINNCQRNLVKGGLPGLVGCSSSCRPAGSAAGLGLMCPRCARQAGARMRAGSPNPCGTPGAHDTWFVQKPLRNLRLIETSEATQHS